MFFCARPADGGISVAPWYSLLDSGKGFCVGVEGMVRGVHFADVTSVKRPTVGSARGSGSKMSNLDSKDEETDDVIMEKRVEDAEAVFSAIQSGFPVKSGKMNPLEHELSELAAGLFSSHSVGFPPMKRYFLHPRSVGVALGPSGQGRCGKPYLAAVDESGTAWLFRPTDSRGKWLSGFEPGVWRPMGRLGGPCVSLGFSERCTAAGGSLLAVGLEGEVDVFSLSRDGFLVDREEIGTRIVREREYKVDSQSVGVYFREGKVLIAAGGKSGCYLLHTNGRVEQISSTSVQRLAWNISRQWLAWMSEEGRLVIARRRKAGVGSKMKVRFWKDGEEEEEEKEEEEMEEEEGNDKWMVSATRRPVAKSLVGRKVVQVGWSMLDVLFVVDSAGSPTAFKVVDLGAEGTRVEEVQTEWLIACGDDEMRRQCCGATVMCDGGVGVHMASSCAETVLTRISTCLRMYSAAELVEGVMDMLRDAPGGPIALTSLAGHIRRSRHREEFAGEIVQIAKTRLATRIEKGDDDWLGMTRTFAAILMAVRKGTQDTFVVSEGDESFQAVLWTLSCLTCVMRDVTTPLTCIEHVSIRMLVESLSLHSSRLSSLSPFLHTVLRSHISPFLPSSSRSSASPSHPILRPGSFSLSSLPPLRPRPKSLPASSPSPTLLHIPSSPISPLTALPMPAVANLPSKPAESLHSLADTSTRTGAAQCTLCGVLIEAVLVEARGTRGDETTPAFDWIGSGAWTAAPFCPLCAGHLDTDSSTEDLRLDLENLQDIPLEPWI